MGRQKKVALRMCLGCRESKPKKNLVRIVSSPEGIVDVDLTGKKPGRGAYVCPQRDCFRAACKGKRFEKNLKTAISSDLIKKIEETLNSLES